MPGKTYELLSCQSFETEKEAENKIATTFLKAKGAEPVKIYGVYYIGIEKND